MNLVSGDLKLGRTFSKRTRIIRGTDRCLFSLKRENQLARAQGLMGKSKWR